MERLKDFFASLLMEPEVMKFFGGILMMVSSAALLLGVRALMFEHRLERAFSRILSITDGKANLPTPPGLFYQWPLIQAMVPETVIGFVTWLTFLATGWVIVSYGKQIDRMF
ncbi:hypothetical protein ACUVJH_15665 [Aeromonas veronii]|uniref:hypothetical protein n=1 Tax=Aeromonas veronii TaxID=654 RepID=UPI004055571C